MAQIFDHQSKVSYFNQLVQLSKLEGTTNGTTLLLFERQNTIQMHLVSTNPSAEELDVARQHARTFREGTQKP